MRAFLGASVAVTAAAQALHGYLTLSAPAFVTRCAAPRSSASSFCAGAAHPPLLFLFFLGLAPSSSSEAPSSFAFLAFCFFFLLGSK